MTLSSVASSAVSLSPFAPASTIFGAGIFLVKAAQGVSDAYDWIDKLFDQLGDFVVRVGQYSEVKSPHLKTKLVQTLECLLEILARSEKIIQDKRAKKYIEMLVFGEDETTNALLAKLAKLLEGERGQVIAETYGMAAEIQEDGKQALEVVKRVEIGQLREDQTKILEWISSTNFPAKQTDLINSRQKGTGLWFLDDPKFDNWIHGSEQTLSCPGMPGAGKTMMAAITIDHLHRTMQSDDVGVAYIYCNYKAQEDQSATSLLAAVLKQLVQARPSIAEPMTRLYEQHANKMTKPELEEISDALQSVLANYSSVYVVVDALDECSDKDGTRSQLLAKLRDLQSKTDLRLMVTSRFVPDIENKFGSVPTLEVRASDADVRKFVEEQISRLHKCVHGDDQLKGLIQDKIAKAVDGM
jgi:hypothetical protein